jgi:hypothetical protein
VGDNRGEVLAEGADPDSAADLEDLIALIDELQASMATFAHAAEFIPTWTDMFGRRKVRINLDDARGHRDLSGQCFVPSEVLFELGHPHAVLTPQKGMRKHSFEAGGDGRGLLAAILDGQAPSLLDGGGLDPFKGGLGQGLVGIAAEALFANAGGLEGAGGCLFRKAGLGASQPVFPRFRGIDRTLKGASGGVNVGLGDHIEALVLATRGGTIGLHRRRETRGRPGA